jgi:hypothetical protein
VGAPGPQTTKPTIEVKGLKKKQKKKKVFVKLNVFGGGGK